MQIPGQTFAQKSDTFPGRPVSTEREANSLWGQVGKQWAQRNLWCLFNAGWDGRMASALAWGNPKANDNLASCNAEDPRRVQPPPTPRVPQEWPDRTSPSTQTLLKLRLTRTPKAQTPQQTLDAKMDEWSDHFSHPPLFVNRGSKWIQGGQ